MVVVGGLVGGGALGYDVVAGFSQRDLYGKGLAAGIAIVVLGVMLDRDHPGRDAARPGPENTTRALDRVRRPRLDDGTDTPGPATRMPAAARR